MSGDRLERVAAALEALSPDADSKELALAAIAAMADEDAGIWKCPVCKSPMRTLIKKGAYSRAARAELAEAVARAICHGQDVNPDDTGVGLGQSMPAGKEYQLWEARLNAANAVLDLMGLEQ